MHNRRSVQMSCTFMLLGYTALSIAQEKGCRFSTLSFRFEGTPNEQARCLLRPVFKGARLGVPLTTLPETLAQLVGAPVAMSRAQLRHYLRERHIDEADIGGSLQEPDSQNADGMLAEYFVIHDTSAPLMSVTGFPETINGTGWSSNNLNRWTITKKAHVFVNRAGESATSINFSVPWRATKLESQEIGTRSRGLFLHVESIQPRHSDLSGPRGNDLIAPQPGFTDKQLERLALIYVAASLRRGHWLTPAFHAAIDAGIPDGHDDPQNFDLQKWSSFVGKVLTDTTVSCGSTVPPSDAQEE